MSLSELAASSDVAKQRQACKQAPSAIRGAVSKAIHDSFKTVPANCIDSRLDHRGLTLRQNLTLRHILYGVDKKKYPKGKTFISS